MAKWPVGATIEGVRWMNAEERRMLGWKFPGVVILLDDGGVIYSAANDSQTKPGVMMAASPGEGPVPLDPRR